MPFDFLLQPLYHFDKCVFVWGVTEANGDTVAASHMQRNTTTTRDTHPESIRTTIANSIQTRKVETQNT